MNVIMLAHHLMRIYEGLITMFQGDAVPASPLPGPSAHPDTPLSEGPSIGAPREPFDVSDIPSISMPMSEGGNPSKASYSSWSPSLDAAAHALKDPEANDNTFPGRTPGLSPSDVEDLWL